MYTAKQRMKSVGQRSKRKESTIFQAVTALRALDAATERGLGNQSA